MKDVLTINRATWRTGQGADKKTGYGETLLLNGQGFMCCLGFRCQQLGVPRKLLEDTAMPSDIEGWNVPDLINKQGKDTRFASKAASLNDDEDLTPTEREAAVTKHFAKKGMIVKFIGKYAKN